MLPENQSNELELKIVKPSTSPLGGDDNLSTYVSGSSAITTRFLKHATGLEVSAGPSGVAHSTRKSEAGLKSVISTKVNISMQEHGGSRTVTRRF